MPYSQKVVQLDFIGVLTFPITVDLEPHRDAEMLTACAGESL